MSYGRYGNDDYASTGYGGAGYGGGYGNSGGYNSGSGFDKQSGLGSNLRSIDWGHQQLSKFEKNFYKEDKRVTARADREIERFRNEKQIKVLRSLPYIGYMLKHVIGFRKRRTKAYFDFRGSRVSSIPAGYD